MSIGCSLAAQRRWIALGLLLLATPLAFFTLMRVIDGPPVIDTSWLAVDAEVSFHANREPPRDAPWTRVRLPDFRRDVTAETLSAWYRVRIPASLARDRLQAVYLHQAYRHVDVFVNDTFIGAGGSEVAPLPVHRGPLYQTFPGALLNAADNAVYLHAVATQSPMALDAVYIGPAEALVPAYRHSHLVKDRIKQISVIVMFAMSIAMTLLFMLRPGDRFYGWFALLILAWGINHVHSLALTSAFENRDTWDAVGMVSAGWFVIAGALFLDSLLGLRDVRLGRVMLAWGIAGSLVLLALSVRLGILAALLHQWLWLPSLFVIGVYMLVQPLRALRQHWRFSTCMLLAPTFLVFVVNVRDYIVYFGIASDGAPTHFGYTPAALLPVFGIIVLRRFVYALRASEALNRELERRVAGQGAALEHSVMRIKGMEHEQALADERERIVRDVHDGVGGQLVQALSLATCNETLRPLEPALRESLDDLRLVIDSLSAVQPDLPAGLGMLRMRMTRRLESRGISFQWDVGDVGPLSALGRQGLLQILRIVQAAITDVIARGGARTIAVRAQRAAAPFAVLVEISDDAAPVCERPVVFDPEALDTDALTDMRRRADALGARLERESAAERTCVRLLWPDDVAGTARACA